MFNQISPEMKLNCHEPNDINYLDMDSEGSEDANFMQAIESTEPDL